MDVQANDAVCSIDPNSDQPPLNKKDSQKCPTAEEEHDDQKKITCHKRNNRYVLNSSQKKNISYVILRDYNILQEVPSPPPNR